MIKAWRCSAMEYETAAFSRCPPEECGGYSKGFCGNRPVLGEDGMVTDDECLPCDAVEVVVIPLAEHEEVQAALAAAEERLNTIVELINGGETNICKLVKIAENGLKLIRTVPTKIREVTK